MQQKKKTLHNPARGVCGFYISLSTTMFLFLLLLYSVYAAKEQFVTTLATMT